MTKIGKHLSKGLLAVLLAVPLSASAGFMSTGTNWTAWDVGTTGTLTGGTTDASWTPPAELTNGSATELMMSSGNYADPPPKDHSILVYATAQADFDFTFEWKFTENAGDTLNDGDEIFGTYLDGAFQALASSDGISGDSMGTATLSVKNGEVFGWYLTATNGLYGPATAIVTTTPTSVPTPATLALLGFGLVALGFVSRRKA